jgi:cardiolipin synthase A/B
VLNSKYLPGHSVQLLHSGDEYFSVLENEINKAQKLIHLQVYIFDSDTTGNKIISALSNAVLRGVHVFLMVDGFGSYSLQREYIKSIESKGIAFRYFSKLPFTGITLNGRRLHHKVCVIDSKIAIVGGINIADKYSGYNEKNAWLDYAILVNGEVAYQLNTVCNQIWEKRFVKKVLELKDSSNGVDPVLIKVSRNDWFRGKNEISASYKNILKASKSEIIIVASYFTPSTRLLKILRNAAENNRQVKIILTRNSDVFMMKQAINYLYSVLLKSGIQIYEYKEAVLHAKVCIVDREWTTIGSHNLNKLSEFLSVELNLEVKDSSFAKSFAEEIDTLISTKCDEIKIEDYEFKQTKFSLIINKFSFFIMTVSLKVLFYLNKNERVKSRRKKRKK